MMENKELDTRKKVESMAEAELKSYWEEFLKTKEYEEYWEKTKDYDECWEFRGQTYYSWDWRSDEVRELFEMFLRRKRKGELK